MLRVGVIGCHQGIARTLAGVGLEVVAHAAGTPGREGLDHARTEVVDGFAGLSERLTPPRLFVLDLPTGDVVDRVVDEAYLTMEPGDVVLDATGSYWGDTLRRFRRMRHRALFYLDLALIGAEPDAIILVAGDTRGIDLGRPLLERLARPGGLIHAGGAGAAHYALMVHEAVATATAQMMGEAQQLLEAYPNAPDAAAVMRGFWPAPPTPGSRAAWLLDDAVRLSAAIPLLAQGVMLDIGQALDEQRPTALPERLHGFISPDKIL